jgi:Uma2 family endonuclease
MQSPALNYMSAADYLTIERNATEKHELLQGQVVAMAGASLAHNEIVANVLGNIKAFLKKKPCRVYPSDLRVHIKSKETFTYPDVTIVCGKPEMLDDQFDTITNPAVIVEVMSRSTQQTDRGSKFFFYMQIPSLKEYILISSTGLFVQTALRQPDGSWKFEEITDINASLPVTSINHQIALSEIYDHVEI